MKKSLGWKVLLSGLMASSAMAALTVDMSNGVLTVTSDETGTIIAKVVDPDDKVIVDERYEGDTFTWTPSGSDGAYRYSVRVLGNEVDGEDTRAAYTGGSLEIVHGQLAVEE